MVRSKIMMKLNGNYCKKEKIMKRIYSFVFAAIAILSAASCQKEIVAPEADSNATAFSFVAEREAETKTTLVNGKSTYWTPGDKVSAFDSKGTAVTFATAITENSPSALFACDLFSLPENGTIHAVYPAKPDATLGADGVIGILRVAGTQKAVAGSFDPAYAVAYAKGQVTDLNTPPALQFTNIHSLVKFTIGGDKAPGTVVLNNGGARNIAGQFSYNTNDGKISQNPDMGAKAITLTPAEGDSFKVGETYYIVVIGGGNFANISLAFDGEVVKAVEGAKYADESNNFLLNKIINLGTVAFPAEEPEQPEEPAEQLPVKRVWGKYAPNADGWIVMGAGNLDRGMAMDNQYIYVSKSTAYAPVIKAFNYDGTEAFECNVTGMGSGNAWGDAMQYSVNCVRTMPKADGSYVLIACNLKLDASHVLEIWAWVNGPQSAPTCIGRYAYDAVANASDHRRYGDRFSVKGTWEDGELWFPSMQADDHGKTIVFKTFEGVDNANRPSAYHRMEPSQSNMKDLAFYPGYDEVFSTCNTIAKFVKLDGTTFSTGWTNWAVTADYTSTHTRTFGYNFFEVNGKKYIAYVKIDKANGRTGRLVVIEDEGDFKNALTANKVAFEAPLQHESDFAAESAANTGNTLGNCNVVTVDGVTYIGAHIQGLGLSLFKIE